MKRFFIVCTSVLLTSSLFAQVPEDAIKYSWQPVNATARIMAVGGAMGSLGGDISAIYMNPAGLGFYKTGDFTLSPGYSLVKNKSNFRGTQSSGKDSYLNICPSGLVIGLPSEGGKWSNKSISFAVNRTASFRNKLFYTGQNDFSSQAEQYAAEAAGSGLFIEDIPKNTSVSFGTRLAVANFVIDTATIPGHSGLDVVSRSMLDALQHGGDFLVNQTETIETSGGITELAIGYAANMHDKLYIGGSIGIPIVSYKKHSVFREEDATGNTNNDFNFNEVNETFTTSGIGANLKLGVIMKPAEFWRIGLAIHSPTIYCLTDKYKGSMLTDLEGFRSTPGAILITTDDILNAGETPTYKYELLTPWKAMLSGSYVLHEVEDVTKQKGFITADIEYTAYKLNHYSDPEGYSTSYYKSVNKVVKDYYKGALNFRVGGELKFTTIMARLGFSYYGNPYKDKELKGNKMFLSGGLGYRDHGMFIDVTYIYGIQKDVSFPYRLPDKANTFAAVKGTGSNIMVTVGVKI